MEHPPGSLTGLPSTVSLIPAICSVLGGWFIGSVAAKSWLQFAVGTDAGREVHVRVLAAEELWTLKLQVLLYGCLLPTASFFHFN